jgi:hypothetical protein
MADLQGGIYRMLIWLTKVVSNVPYAAGSAGSSLANGATSHAYLIDSIRDYTPQNAEINTQVAEGGDEEIGSMQFGSSRLRGFEAVLTDVRRDMITNIAGTTQDTTTNSVWSIWTEESNALIAKPGGAAIASLIQDLDTGSSYWETVIMTSCKMIFTIEKGGFR